MSVVSVLSVGLASIFRFLPDLCVLGKQSLCSLVVFDILRDWSLSETEICWAQWYLEERKRRSLQPRGVSKSVGWPGTLFRRHNDRHSALQRPKRERNAEVAMRAALVAEATVTECELSNAIYSIPNFIDTIHPHQLEKHHTQLYIPVRFLTMRSSNKAKSRAS